ncbi:MAG TPA: hypothetical protein VF884_03360 [Nitrososphaeraceae archaeon]
MDIEAEEKLIEWLRGRDLTVDKQSDGYTVHTIRKNNSHLKLDYTELEAIYSMGVIHEITVDYDTRSIWIGLKKT